MANKNSSDLDRAVEQHRAETEPQQAVLPALLAEAEPAEFQPPATRPRGRPAGVRNLSSERYSAALRAELAQDPRYSATGGDPLRAATRVAALDVLDDETLNHFARLWGCTRFQVVQTVGQFGRDVLSYHHQQLPRAVIVNPGAPGAERVLVEIEGDYHEVGAEDYAELDDTLDAPAADEAA